jgi:formylglycine-generating enzyme required for sulfatase activity
VAVVNAALAVAAATAMAAWLAAATPLQQPAAEPDQQIKKAGVCARCHVISVIEWGMSRHFKAGTDCVACHGVSTGHVVDERNNVKPERVPHDAAIAGLCATCHTGGCPKSHESAGCQKCHHVHALVNPAAPPPAAVAPPAARIAPVAHTDIAAGLPRTLRVPGTDIELALLRGGTVDLGSAQLAMARPVHTVRVEPFYLGVREISEGEWTKIMGPRAGTPPADPMLPASRISWNDAQAFLRALNSSAPGAGFRLPTEAEWEFAARAGESPGVAALNLKGPRAISVGRPNPAGVADLRGNVWEWCSSLSRPYPYDASDGREASDGPGMRILRGGGFADLPGWTTPATRHPDRPDRRLPWYGFRVARTAAGVGR